MSIREVNAVAITDVVEELCIRANTQLPPDVKQALELCRAAKVLEHLAVFIRNCDFHKGPPVCFIVCQNNCRSGWQRMSFSSFF